MTDALEKLRGVVEEGRAVRALDEGIYSVLPDESHAHLYDRRAAVYDLLVGTRLYNRVLWGDTPRGYGEFARRAFASGAGGAVLDAACGSMLFSAPAYLDCGRQIIAFDQSLAMLRRARARLSRMKGYVPENVLLLQGDLGDLPFRPGSFQTVLCMNVLHQFEDAASLLPKLEALVGAGGSLFLTSLVRTGRLVGDVYLGLLHASGEFVRPRGGEELEGLLRQALRRGVSSELRGNMLYAATDGGF
jgi:ubiquinone/menaquinone biosynthesis C-methylase UbiE